ncbi:hypothetical protein P3T73_17930 [Kiritimatiellota bacterium B12222]|nr:hypothetical protein P3T73_17930 [Kiritimatiellota bacterium B12222]
MSTFDYMECEFCKTHLDIVFMSEEMRVKALSSKWEEKRAGMENRIQGYEKKLGVVRDELEREELMRKLKDATGRYNSALNERSQTVQNWKNRFNSKHK